MAGSVVDNGMGVTLVGGTSGFTGELISLSVGGMTREAIEVSHMAIATPTAPDFGGKAFIPADLSDPGNITFTVHANTGQATANVPPINSAAETWTITWPQTGAETAATWVCTGFVTDTTLNMEMEAPVTFDITVKLTGTQNTTAAV